MFVMFAGSSISILVLLLLIFVGAIRLPVYPRQFGGPGYFNGLPEEGDQIIGGGYSFGTEARDIWIRIRLNESSELPRFDAFAVEECHPDDLELIRIWFLEQAERYQRSQIFLARFNRELPNQSEWSDQVVLDDLDHLVCHSMERYLPLTHRFGEYPKSCNFGWLIYHEPSRFYYSRDVCFH